MDNKARWVGMAAVTAVGLCVLTCAGVGLAIRYAPDLLLWTQQRSSLKVGSPAPDFTLGSLDGQTVLLSQFKGHPVLLTFAASWCPACRAEAPELQSLHQRQPELTILLVDSNEQDDVVRGFAGEFGMTHPVLLDRDGRISDRYRIFAIPTTFFIDSQGIIRGLIIDGVTPGLLAEKLPLIGVNP